MAVQKIIPYAHQLLKAFVKQGDVVIDATVGNGNDTVLLSQLVGEKGKVFGFDIQAEAIERTTERLQNSLHIHNVQLFLAGHEKVKSFVPEQFWGKISASIFNLGYLPKGNHQITTKADTTILAIQDMFEIMKSGGIIVLVIYSGHPEGKVEKEVVMDYVKSIDQTKADVLLYQFINQKNAPPFIIAIEKK